ncbi:MAG: 3-hydroxyacyl-CoA dehydrogenase NAD-binding domain-containing protein [Pseudomonadota bacterium]
MPALNLTQSDVAAYVTQAAHDAWIVPDVPADTPLRPVTNVGVIGAGTMGGGISMNFATAGIPVTILEREQEALDRGLGVCRKNYQRSADKGRFPQDEVELRMGLLNGTLSVEDFADCDLIIEAVFEDMDVKKSIFRDLDRVAKPGAILATNTSALNIDEIASVTERPQDVIGLHFFSPANVMKLLEIVRADHTADDVIATSMTLAKTINKVATLVGVCPGFVGNRILFARQAQAHNLLMKGVTPWAIDAAINGFGFRMGPYQMSDLAGLDIGWKKGATTDNPIRDALCELDRRGQKTRAGFYDYDENNRPVPSEVTAEIITRITGVESGQAPSDGEIIAARIHPMINEGLKILEEGKAQRASDIDIVWLNGYGWPADKGGPMLYGDMVGAEAVLATMDALAADDPSAAPCETLKRLAQDGSRFIDVKAG